MRRRATGIVIGVDVAEPRKGLDLVALDRHRRVVASVGRATVADVAALTAELEAEVVCIDAPSGWATSGRSRCAERDLRRLGITAFCTPTDPGDRPFYRWMRVGLAVFDALSRSHPVCTGTAVAGTAAEVFPEASAVLLAGRLRGPDESKLHFRSRVLQQQGIDRSELPTIDRVDAALAALTGALALDGCCSVVGDPGEGVVLLPVATLPTARLQRPPGPAAPRSAE